MKIVEPENANKYLFLGGIVSPETLFEGLHVYAYIAAGCEIVKIHFDTEKEAEEAEKRLKYLSADSIAEIKREGNVLITWPKYLKKDPQKDKTRKYRISYKVLTILEAIGDLYYNDENGEIYVDDATDESIVTGIVKSSGQNLYVEIDHERECAAIGAIEFVTRRQEE